jgi:hypothetical protein
MQQQIPKVLDLCPDKYDLSITVAGGSGMSLPSEMRCHKEYDPKYSYRHLLLEVLPKEDYIFGVGTRARGFNVAGWVWELLPLIKASSEIVLVQAGGTLPQL